MGKANGDDNDTGDNMHGEKSLFCSEIRGEKHKTSDPANVTTTDKGAASSAGVGKRAARGIACHARTHSGLLTRVAFFFPQRKLMW